MAISDGESGGSVRTKLNASLLKTDGISSLGSGAIITTDERNKLANIEAEAEKNDVSLRYMAEIDLTGPTLTDIIKTYAGSVSIVKDDVGEYTITNDGGDMIENKTIVRIMLNAVCFYTATLTNDTTIDLHFYDTSGAPSDPTITGSKIEIFTYSEDLPA